MTSLNAIPVTSIDQLLSTRHSCRAFTNDPVPRATVTEILRLAQKTASWTNMQPWQVHIVSGNAIERFRDAMTQAAQNEPSASDLPWPTGFTGVYQSRRRDCGWGLYASVGITKGDRVASAQQSLKNFAFFGAPHVAIVTTDSELGLYGAVDCGAYVSNFMLAATSLGVGTIAQAALASRAPTVREFLGLTSDRKVLCGISFGYSDTQHPANAFRTSRAPLEEVVSWVE